VTLFILCSLSVLFAIWGFYNYLGYRAHRRKIKQTLKIKYGEASERKSFIVLLGDRFDQTKWAIPMKHKLQKANIPLAPSEFLGMMLVGGMAVAIFFNMVFDIRFPLNILIAIATVLVIYWMLFVIRRNKYIERLNGQLSEVCRLLAGSTRAGMTVNQGIDLVAREMSAPIGSEFRQLANELRLGVDFDRALRKLQERIPSRDFKLFVSTLLIQKKAGGNLYAVLDEMAHTLDERKVLEQTIKTMTAQEKYISYLLPIMPIFLLLMMNTITDGFLDPLWTLPGMILGGIFLIGTVISLLLVIKVTKIRV